MIAGFLFKKRAIKSVLVVCPLSIMGVWVDEFNKFANFNFEMTVLNQTNMAKKKEALQNVCMRLEDVTDSLQVIVVNYESAWRLEREISLINPDLIIADEGHKLKSGTTSQSKCMHRLGDKATYKLLLTGTVITNKEIDVFSQYRFLDKTIFGESFYKFRNYYFIMGGYGNHTPIFKKDLLDDFLKKMHSVAFRVKKDECLDLPEITEEIRELDMEPEALKLYKQLDEELYAKVGEDKEITTANILTKILRLSQITGGYLTDDNGGVTPISTAKMEALIDIVDSAVYDNKKIVIIARFKQELDAIENMLSLKKLDYAVIRGGISDRDEQIKKFQEDDNCKFFVGQIAAAGLGITLTAASTMVFYSMDYSMSNFEQCKARIHRAGQTKNCHYIYLICKKTIDRKVLRALRTKQDLAKSLIDDYKANIKTMD